MFLSFITVTYNAASTLERTLLSVEAQTCGADIEHLIIDGASTDDTLNIAQAYKQRNPDRDITIVSEPDHGLYDAMNKGLHRAKGDYVCFLNAGDKLHDPHTVEHIIGQVQTDAAKGIFAVIYGDTDVVDNDGKFLRKRHLTPPEQLTWRSFSNGMLVCHQSFYARRELCPDYNTAYRFSADVDWCIRVMKAGARRGLNNYHTHTVMTDYLDEGMTTRNHRASLIERFKIMSNHYGFLLTTLKHFTFLFR